MTIWLRTIATAALLALALGRTSVAAAAPANPELTARINGIDDEEANRNATLRIGSLDIRVRIHGGTAETTVTARFDNPGDDRLEGNFALAMPAGSTVTGYALNIGDVMVDGVLLDQIEARRAYLAQVRRRIDPGLGEVSRGFVFSSRVYPIMPKGSRTISLRFVTPLDPKGGYALALAQPQPVAKLTVSLEASGVASPPDASLAPLGSFAWQADGTGYRAEAAATDVVLDGSLRLAAPERSAALSAGRGIDGGRYFEIVDARRGGGGEAAAPQKLAILWDRSLSRADDALESEIAFLRAYVERVRPESLELFLFDAGAVETIPVTSPRELADRLRRVTYRGATSFSGFAGRTIVADTCLLFSDGIVTLGRRDDLHPRCALHAVSSAPDADRAWLGALARASGGEELHLASGNAAALLDRLTRRTPRVAEVRSAAGAPIDFVVLDAPAGAWRIVGPMPAEGAVTVRIAGIGRAFERTYAATAPVADWSGAEALWAADRLAVRAAAGSEPRDDLIAFARRHSVAGPDISFLVLETPEDYANARIAPPPTLGAELLERYRRAIADRDDEQRVQRKAQFDRLLERWEAQKSWWRTTFNPLAKADPAARGSNAAPSPPPPPVIAPAPPAPAPAVGDILSDLPAVLAKPNAGTSADPGDDASVIVTGSRIPQPNLTSVTPVTALSSEEISSAGKGDSITAQWSPDRPYIAALKAARPSARESVLAAQQARHGALPVFWLDVADLYRREGRRAESLRLLLSALELPTRDSETIGLVAERLARWGDLDRAVALYEKMVALDPKHPHPQRGLALALARRAATATPERARADLARAVAILSKLVLEVDDEEYEGFNIVALTELNSIIARYRRLGGSEVPLDPRLVENLTMDLRIVLEWKDEQIDVDMWVLEPNGEKASYWNDGTSIGGRMSPETTDGTGPEQYMLRRAPAGTFVVKADVWSDDPLTPNGRPRAIARIYRDFGRPSEREETFEVELTSKETSDTDDDDAIPIATLKISR